MSEYLVSQVEVLDPAAWERYRALAAPAIAKFGGRYLVRGARPEVLEADWAPPHAGEQQLVVVEFPDRAAVPAWYASPEYAEAMVHREAALRRRLITAAGVDETVGGRG